MSKKNLLSLTFLLVFVFALIQCGGKDEPNPTGGPSSGSGSVVGSWDNGTYFLVLFSNGTFDAYLSGSLTQKKVWGIYSVSGNQITLTDTGGVPFSSGESYACPASEVGVYSFTVTATILDFTLISDPCPGRIAGVSAAFTKQGNT